MTLTRRLILASLTAAAVAQPASAAPSSRPIAGPWQQFGTEGDPDHGPWGAFLDRYLVAGDPALIRYAAAIADRARPTAYLAAMQTVDPTRLSRPAAMAFWINLYNAITIDLVLADWPVSSIKEVRGGLFDLGPWDEEVVTIAGVRLSLDDIEHGILRPVWQDARIHYAVNCAAIGCPNLADAPYTASRLEEMLETGARAFVNHPRGVRLEGNGLVLSSIYDWFSEDWGGEADLLAHLRAYASGRTRDALNRTSRIVDYRYDWGLNAA